ncbi:penicillin acylase family protein [Pseudoalteromonas sp. R3]|uniref:penicillin acylase family protein n=1 Tax=Pseudoalteromonas sp. R3 TaxID=1709477 RepID=UPI0006B64DAA|nr:penicillin acylase family protein [Pseudoalteromonas sp. R3]AZZ99767.1 peptidase S45 [Pseudoalteromonas sp. R3]
MNFFKLSMAGLSICMGSAVAAQQAASTPAHFNAQESVRITRTHLGIAHVKADTLYGLGYGNAFAQAQDHACILADGYLRQRGERAKYLGAHRRGQDNYYLYSDIGYRILDLPGRVAQHYDQMSDNSKALAEGFAAGYNHFLSEVAAGRETLDQACRDQSWVKPITAHDVVSSLMLMSVQGSLGRMLPMLIQAAPPQSDSLSGVDVVSESVGDITQGSNGWALGQSVTANGRGMVLANPHFPFNGNSRFWTHHATIPGELDVMGASVVGVPGVVNIGFNRNLAWTHTFSSALHHVFYRLTMDPNNPLRYRYEGQWRDLQTRQIQIPVKTAGGIETHEHTAYTTHFGFLLEDAQNFPWQGSVAFAVRDVNLENFEAIDHWLAYNKAASIDELAAASARYNGLSFNNTLAADRLGETFYTDDSNVPDLSPVALEWLRTDPFTAAVFASTGQVVLPGDRSDMIFNGAIDLDKSPSLRRRDYVQNSNDSFWLTNPEQPIREVSPLFGKVDAKQSERSRYAHELLNTQRGRDGRFDLSELEKVILGNGSYYADQRAVVAGLCQHYGGQTLVLSEQVSAQVDPICAAFAQWDGQFNLDSKAAHLAREFFRALDTSQDFVVPFDATQPTTTPHTLKSERTILEKLLSAGVNLQHYGFALDAPYGEIQYLRKGSERMAWPGPDHSSGGFNMFAPANGMDLTSFAKPAPTPLTSIVDGQPLWSELTRDGYEVNYGSSWMMVVGFDYWGPVAKGLLLHSQSANRNSVHFSDSSRRYAQQGGLITLPFYPWQIALSAISSTKLIVKKD